MQKNKSTKMEMKKRKNREEGEKKGKKEPGGGELHDNSSHKHKAHLLCKHEALSSIPSTTK
jgi:hypothetical protein